ncbi:MAG: hypothetical protein NVSMB19_06440 [Vulcanimicrobiaceae bacterium]
MRAGLPFPAPLRKALWLAVVLGASIGWATIRPDIALAAMPAGQPVDGISCDVAEGAVFHIHPHLTIFERGKPLAIPPDIGRPVVPSCLYWLHTHTPDGLIHIEAPRFRTFTLGEFFDIWGQPLRATAVASARARPGQIHAFVDGKVYRGDLRKIELSQHTDITLEVGAPYVKPVPFTDWKGQ